MSPPFTRSISPLPPATWTRWRPSLTRTSSGTRPGSINSRRPTKGERQPFASFAAEFERSGGTYDVDVRDVVANDEHIVALLHATANCEGRLLDQDYVIVFEMRDGIVHVAWEIWKDQPSVDSFWS